MKVPVAHVIKSLEPGGAETNLCHLLEAFKDGRFEHHVVYTGSGGALQGRFEALSGVRLACLSSSTPRRIASLSTLGAVARLASYLRRHRIRIVHTHNFDAHVWGAFAAKRWPLPPHAKVVEHVHDFRYFEPAELERRGGSARLNRFIGVFRGLSDRVLVLTEQNRDLLLGRGFYPEDRVRLIPNGVAPPPSSDRGSARARLGLRPDEFVVFTASRFSKTKNLDLVLRMAREAMTGLPQAVFVIAGDGPLLEDHRGRATPNVRLLGFLPQIDAWLDAADVFLLPSFLELHSIAILEAMSRALPLVISAGVGCHDQWIRSWDNGVLLDPFSDEGWLEALRRLRGDDGLRQRVGREGQRLWRERFLIDLTARRITEVYDELAR